MGQTFDELYEEVKGFVIKTNKCNLSHIKDNFGLGILTTQRLIKRLEAEGIVTKFNDMDREREVLNEMQLNLFGLEG
ncbi:MAG: DNA translocase FtsK [Melioribacteraceae bacterium]|nr:DNA translocase FtsK [Melioribacteraceae bacterium]